MPIMPNAARASESRQRSRGPAPRLAIANDECGEKRIRILVHATQEFLAHGFEGTNLDDIANAAGVGKVTIYRFFKHKADLFAQCVLQAVSDATVSLRNLLDPDLPIEQVLVRFTKVHATRMLHLVAGARPFYEVMRMLVGTSARYPELTDACREVFGRDVGAPLKAYFQAAIDRGEVVCGDAEVLADRFVHIISFTSFAILDPQQAPAASELRSYAEQTVQLFLYGCASRPSVGHPQALA